jgi:hypothetical protein
MPRAGEAPRNAAAAHDLRRTGPNMRPATSRTCGRSVTIRADTPRITTLDGLPEPRLSSEISTTVSFDASGCPSAPSATAGWLIDHIGLRAVDALCTSVSASLRIRPRCRTRRW